MVAKITVPAGIKRALNYNEQKVKEGSAECIYAHNFLKDADTLRFFEKLTRFEKLISLNKRASTNAVHISLNFAPNENLRIEKLIDIAIVYMGKIGFDQQPYLVYEHRDAGHPHIHIVTSNIRKDGTRISLHNLGKNQANRARKDIENDFGLIKAEKQKRIQTEKIDPVALRKIHYGKSPTKRAISNVLAAVIPEYRFSSLAELNAVLKLYNVVADKGKAGSKIEEHHGLVYRVLDAEGNKIGVPIKASSLPGKPTLFNLEKIFAQNETLKAPFKKSVRASIDWVLLTQHKTLQSFAMALEKEKIGLVFRQNDQGIIYGLTYIDHSSKTVFNGSDIGKGYSARAILDKCGRPEIFAHQNTLQIGKDVKENITISEVDRNTLVLDPNGMLETLIAPVETYEQIPHQLKRKKKKKIDHNN